MKTAFQKHINRGGIRYVIGKVTWKTVPDMVENKLLKTL